jgi:hypothetical protein
MTAGQLPNQHVLRGKKTTDREEVNVDGQEEQRRSAGWRPAARPGGDGRRRLVDGVRIVDGSILLDADPAWAGAINTVLVKSGVRVSELRRADRRWRL